MENPDLLDYGDNNKFLKLTDESIGIHVDQEIFVGERYVKVLKVMVCNKKWLNRNYYEPKERTKNLLKYKKYGSENGCCSKSNGKIIFCSIFIIFYLILQTCRAGTKVGLSDPVQVYGNCIAQRIKGTPGITG